jgi:hypothetical protein
LRGGLYIEIHFVGRCVAKYILKDTEQKSTPEGGCRVEYILRGLYGVHSEGLHILRELYSGIYFEGDALWSTF